jgi:glycosyltransferase involved in cell wall biosynthesis
MEEPEPRPSRDPQTEIELLREKLHLLEVENAEVQQKLFDQYEWTREKTKAFKDELQSLRSISLEYKVLHFLRVVYQRTTGLPWKTLEEEVEKLKIFVAAVPRKNDPNTDQWLRALLNQTHPNFEVTVVIGNSDPEPSQDIKDSSRVRIVRTEDNYSDAIRANIGLCFGSGDVWGVFVGGYWPYPRSLENVARFFAERPACQVMLPSEFALVDVGLIVPTEYPGVEDFQSIWKNYTGQHGSFFVRPRTYKKVGRINYEAGDAWLFGTLLQLSWYDSVWRTSAFIAVNGAPRQGQEERSRIESANGWVRQHFFNLGFFNEYKKAVWHFPIEQSSPRWRSRRIAIEKVFRRVCGVLESLRHKQFSRDFSLYFPIAERQLASSPSDQLNLSRIEPCPLTGRLPDRFLFSLAPFNGGRLADAYYASETSLAIVNRERSATHSTVPDGAANNLISSEQAAWRFVGLEGLVGAAVSPLSLSQPTQGKSEQAGELPTEYGKATAAMLSAEKVTDALWIGDPWLSLGEDSDVPYREQRRWEDNPALSAVDYESLAQSNLLSGRTTTTGYELIHLAGVLQFCRRPRHLLRFLASALKFEASILVATPNLDSVDLERFGPGWCHWEPWRTCFIYSVRSLRALMRHCGFEEKKLITFSHASWRLASRGNLAKSIPAQRDSSRPDVAADPIGWRQGGVSERAPNLKGDYLIGLFSRKL